MQHLGRQNLVAAERNLARVAAPTTVDAETNTVGVIVGLIDLNLDQRWKEPRVDKVLARCRGEPVPQQVEHDIVRPRPPQTSDETIVLHVPRDVEHRASSTSDAVLEIDGTLRACGLGRGAHLGTTRAV